MFDVFPLALQHCCITSSFPKLEAGCLSPFGVCFVALGMGVQLQDPAFRRHILVQFLIMSRYLMDGKSGWARAPDLTPSMVSVM